MEVVSEALVNLNPECSTPTLDNIPRLLFKTTEIDRRRLWGDSAYHNLVQLLMDNSSKPAKRRTGDDFIAGWLMFAEVVRIIQPSHCLFIGVSSAKTFDISMASQNLSFDKIYRPAHVGGVRPGLAKLEIAGTATKLIFVHHLGWCKSLSQWHEYLQTEHADFMS